MDAISDVSRASQIFSSVPRRPPLPKPFDLDELLGFKEALRRRRSLNEEVVDQTYLGKSKIFINHVDSFIGKHLVNVSYFWNTSVWVCCVNLIGSTQNAHGKMLNILLMLDVKSNIEPHVAHIIIVLGAVINKSKIPYWAILCLKIRLVVAL